MCPMCMTTAAVVTASAASGAGVFGFLVLKIHTWRRRVRGRRSASRDDHVAWAASIGHPSTRAVAFICRLARFKEHSTSIR